LTLSIGHWLLADYFRLFSFSLLIHIDDIAIDDRYWLESLNSWLLLSLLLTLDTDISQYFHCFRYWIAIRYSWHLRCRWYLHFKILPLAILAASIIIDMDYWWWLMILDVVLILIFIYWYYFHIRYWHGWYWCWAIIGWCWRLDVIDIAR